MSIPAITPVQIILNYHKVSDSILSEGHFSIHPDKLRTHFEILKNQHAPVIATDEIEYAAGLPFTIAVSFDDGNLSDLKIVQPLLLEFGFNATFFPIINQVGMRDKMDWQHIKELVSNGFSIGSHGLSQDIMIKQSLETQSQEMLESKSTIENNLGVPVTQFAFPFGRHDDHLLELCKQCGYKQALTTGLKLNKLKEDKFLLFRWNITNKTDINLFKQVVTSSGTLSPALEMNSRLNSFVRDISGKSTD